MSSPAGVARVMRLNMIIVVGVLAVIFVPFLLLSVSQSPSPAIAIIALPLVLVLGALGYASVAAGKRMPTVLFLTDRRAIVENYGSGASSAAMGLETLGDVKADQNNWAGRRAGVVLVYLLPMGTSQAMVGSGRNRHAAPGVIWAPAMPVAEAQELRGRLLRQARDLQARLGFPSQPGFAPPPGYATPPGYAPSPPRPPPPPQGR